MPRNLSKKLGKRQISALKKHLESEQAGLLESAATSMKQAMAWEAQTGDEADETVDELLRASELRLRGRERVKLRKIKKALTRIEEGGYNECEECEEPIGFERLQARPVATLCIRCKLEQERRENLSADRDRTPQPTSWR